MKETFESQILSNIDDPEGYSVYSDWLTEQGDPRGEFIRLQMQLQDESLDADLQKDLVKKEKKLLKDHSKIWMGDLANIKSAYEYVPPPTVDFVWGFPYKLTVNHLDAETAKFIAASTSARFIRELELGAIDSVYDLEEVEVGQQPSSLYYLLDSENLGNLRTFKLGDTAFDQQYYNCETQGFGVIEFLNKFEQLQDVRIGARDADAAAIFALPLPNLRTLHLMHEYSYPVSILAENPAMANLEDLAILPHAMEYDSDPYLDLEDLRAVCASSHLKKLRRLCFRLTNMGDAAAEVIVDSDILDHLRVLDLANGNLTDAGAEILASSPKIKKLQQMNFNRNALTQTGIDALMATGVAITADGQHSGDAEEGEWLYEGDIE